MPDLVMKKEVCDPDDRGRLQSQSDRRKQVVSHEELNQRLDRLESMLSTLVEQQTVRDWYTTDQFARLVGKAEFTVREWCRHGRVRAQKRQSGRGAHPAWVVSHDELRRYQKEGLLPSKKAGTAH
jgi:hypothetical protein